MNDPKVVSEGEFICGVCDKTFPSEEEVTNHKSGVHDNAKTANNSAVDNTDDDLEENNSNLLISDKAEEEAEESNLFDPEDDQDLNDAFEELSQELARHEEEIENKR